MHDAVETLKDCLHNKKMSALQLRAAIAIIEMAQRNVEIADLGARVEQLEEALEDQKQDTTGTHGGTHGGTGTHLQAVGSRYA